MRSLTVVCPVYNEESVIERFYGELRAVLDRLSPGYESRVLFVVDKSTDATMRILKRLAAEDPRALVLSLSSRFGHQRSLLAGLDHCDSDAVIMMDSDLQHPPTLIPRMLEQFENGCEIVLTQREDPPEIGFLKRLSSRLFYRFINAISEVPILENAADFRLLSRRVVEIFQRDIRERNLFLRGLVSWVGFHSERIRFRTGMREGGSSKYSLGRLCALGLGGVVSFSRKPLHAAIFLGFGFAGLGLLLALITFVQYLLNWDFPRGWATIAILISTFSGIQLIFLGVLGEYIGAIFEEVKARPHYIVDERLNLGPRETLSKR